MKSYSKEDRPFDHSSHNSPVNVALNIEVNFLSDISVKRMEYQMDLVLFARWRDDRLALNSSDFEGRQGNSAKPASIGYLKNKLWMPDLFYRNSKEINTFDLLQPNTLVWLYPKGHVVFSQKIRVVLNCPLDLWNFPFDTQYCKAIISSYGYTEDDLLLKWAVSVGKNNLKQKYFFILYIINDSFR